MRYLEFEKPLREIESKIEQLEVYATSRDIDLSGEIKPLKEKLGSLLDEIFSHLTPWQRVQLARHPDRPYCLDFLQLIAEDFTELHGDRAFRDDEAIVAGFCSIGGSVCLQPGAQGTRFSINADALARSGLDIDPRALLLGRGKRRDAAGATEGAR